MNTKVCLLAELPETLHQALGNYLKHHPGWDQDRAIAVALALFLMQNSQDQAAARIYLDTLFGEVS